MLRRLFCSGALAIALGAALPAAADAAWPGSNGMIAFVCGGICVMNSDGTGLVHMPYPPDGAGNQSYPSWSPDGNKLVFTGSTAATFPFEDVYIVNADGTGLKRLTTDPGYESSPSFTPDGTRVLFASTRPGGRIYSVALDGTDEREIVHDGSHYDGAPRMNPAGTRILFERNLLSEGVELWSMAPDGSDVRFVTGGQVADWAPDGSRITWPSSSGSGFSEIWTMAPDGTDRRALYQPTSSETETFNASYSPDGRFVVSTRSIATSSTPGTTLPLLWATEIANPANHRALFPNPAAPSDADDFGYVYDAVWQPCVAGVTSTCRTVAIKPPSSGGGGSGGPIPTPPPVLLPRTISGMSAKRKQRGARVTFAVKVKAVPAKLLIRATAGGRTVASRVVKVSKVGTRRVTVKLTSAGRHALRRKGRLSITLSVRGISQHGEPAKTTKRVTLRRA